MQWLLLMENLNPHGYFPKADGVSIQKNLGIDFFRTIASPRQDLGRLCRTIDWHCGKVVD
jgi:hypothetical protein